MTYTPSAFPPCSTLSHDRRRWRLALFPALGPGHSLQLAPGHLHRLSHYHEALAGADSAQVRRGRGEQRRQPLAGLQRQQHTPWRLCLRHSVVFGTRSRQTTRFGSRGTAREGQAKTGREGQGNRVHGMTWNGCQTAVIAQRQSSERQCACWVWVYVRE